jgi:hypothetical protein
MPSITSWTRIEPHTRNAEMKNSVQARIYDPPWMLARQWQVGEFQGKDSGTPVMARLRAEISRLTRYFAGPIAPNTKVTAPTFDAKVTPLETMVERERVRPLPAAKGEKLRLAVETAQHFFRLLDLQPIAPANRENYRGAFKRKYPFSALTTAERGALDADSLAFFDLVSERVPDGRLLYAQLRAALHPSGGGAGALPPDLQIAPEDAPKVQNAAETFFRWFETLFSEPGRFPATWVPERMEYAFSVATGLNDGECTLTAQEYFDGHLDWEDFSVNAEVSLGAANDKAITLETTTVIPAPVNFRGAPAPRFWEFEDAQVDYGAISTGPADLPHMLLIEFANSFGNDWFVIPVELEIGSLCRTRSLVVTDTFGVRTLIKSNSESGVPHSAWRMFQLSFQRPEGSPPLTPASNLFFLPPALAKDIEGKPLEEVLFLRDEMANMAWGVERLVESSIEQPLSRYESAATRAGASQPLDSAGGIPVYRLASQVPEYWTPLLPVQIQTDANDATKLAVRLVRGAVLKPDGSQPIVRSQGRVLNPDGKPSLNIYEEEVPREGARVTRSYQLARWLDGSTHLWMGRRKQVGRGEGSSGLRFDTAEER